MPSTASSLNWFKLYFAARVHLACCKVWGWSLKYFPANSNTYLDTCLQQVAFTEHCNQCLFCIAPDFQPWSLHSQVLNYLMAWEKMTSSLFVLKHCRAVRLCLDISRSSEAEEKKSSGNLLNSAALKDCFFEPFRKPLTCDFGLQCERE